MAVAGNVTGGRADVRDVSGRGEIAGAAWNVNAEAVEVVMTGGKRASRPQGV